MEHYEDRVDRVRQFLYNIKRQAEEIDMSTVPILAEMHFAMTIHRLTLLDLENLDLEDPLQVLRTMEAVDFYRKAIHAVVEAQDDDQDFYTTEE